MKLPMNRLTALALVVLLSSCSEREDNTALPDQPNRWVDTVNLQEDSKASHVGKTSTVMGATTIKPLSGLRAVSVGDEIEGVRIGAISCSFHPKDASYSGQQFMWQGRWGCIAGRDENEVKTAVQEDGTKLHDYVHISPVTLP